MRHRVFSWGALLALVLALLTCLGWSQQGRKGGLPPRLRLSLTPTGPRPRPLPGARLTYLLDLTGYRGGRDAEKTVLVYRVPAPKARIFATSHRILRSSVQRYLIAHVPPSKNRVRIQARTGEIIYVALQSGVYATNPVAAPGAYPPTAGNDPIIWLAPPAGTAYNLVRAYQTTLADPSTYNYFLIAQPFSQFCLDTSQVTTPGVNNNGIVALAASSNGFAVTLKGTLTFNTNASGPYIVWVARQLKTNSGSKVYEQFMGSSGGTAEMIQF